MKRGRGGEGEGMGVRMGWGGGGGPTVCLSAYLSICTVNNCG